MASVWETYAKMNDKHLCERLRHLAEHRTPAVAAGYVCPTVPVPFGEWLLLQEAAKRIERMADDISILKRELSRAE